MTIQTQTPDPGRISHVLTRITLTYGQQTAEQVADWLVEDWTAAQEAPHRGQGAYTAAQLLIRAGNARSMGQPALAGSLDLLAECCARAWSDELAATVAGLDTEDDISSL